MTRGAIHPSAVISEGATLGAGVDIGPYCVIGPRVTLGDGCVLKSHVVVDGLTTLGPGVEIYPFASIGTRTQDLKYRGGETAVDIGERTVIREYVTVNAATTKGGVTRVGARCLLMATAHVAHDCIVGDEVVIANSGMLAGHVEVGDQAIIGGLSGVHQFVRIGRLAFVGGYSRVTQDIPPFMLAEGSPLTVYGPNQVGLKRRGFTAETLGQLKEAYRRIYRSGMRLQDALRELETRRTSSPEVAEVLDFVKTSERGITR